MDADEVGVDRPALLLKPTAPATHRKQNSWPSRFPAQFGEALAGLVRVRAVPRRGTVGGGSPVEIALRPQAVAQAEGADHVGGRQVDGFAERFLSILAAALAHQKARKDEPVLRLLRRELDALSQGPFGPPIVP